MDCILDSTVVSCKALDVTNGNKEKLASVLLKRGRMILKKRYDSRKHALRNTLFKATMSGRELYKARLEDVDTVNQSGLGLPNDNLVTAAGTPTLKEAIKLEDKLISGEEIEYCPAYHIDSQHTECVTDGTVECSANENSRQSKVSRTESSKFYFDDFESDGISHNSSEKSPINAEDYPKLYITVTDTSDKDATTKSSLLKSIRSIQNVNGDSYGINISNSRFFVPKDYIFSGVESAMNDLKFEVDPEMGRLLQRSYSSPQVNLSSLGNAKANLSSLDDRLVETSTTLSVDLTKQPADPDFRNAKALSDSSVCLKSKENSNEQKQLFFKRESKPSCEVPDSILDETTLKSKTIAESQTRNAELLYKFNNCCSTHDNKEKSQKTKYEDHESFLLNDETKEREASCNNQLWTAEHVIIDDDQISTKPLCLNIAPGDKKVLDTLEESKILSSPDENIEIKSPTTNINVTCEEIKSSHDLLNVPLMRRKSYPLLTPSEIAYKSKCSSTIPVVSLDRPTAVSNIHSFQSFEENEAKSISESSVNQVNHTGSSVCNKQVLQCSNPSEINRLNRIRFLQGSILSSENDSHIEKVTSESKLPTMSEEVKMTQSNADLESDQPPSLGRTSSLREKFETIVEDVELRTLSKRRSYMSESCGRKSLS